MPHHGVAFSAGEFRRYTRNEIMYEAKKSEREILVRAPYNYNPKVIDLLDVESDKVRQGIPIDFQDAVTVCNYQSDLQSIRKSQNKWWQFWA